MMELHAWCSLRRGGGWQPFGCKGRGRVAAIQLGGHVLQKPDEEVLEVNLAGREQLESRTLLSALLVPRSIIIEDKCMVRFFDAIFQRVTVYNKCSLFKFQFAFPLRLSE